MDANTGQSEVPAVPGSTIGWSPWLLIQIPLGKIENRSQELKNRFFNLTNQHLCYTQTTSIETL